MRNSVAYDACSCHVRPYQVNFNNVRAKDFNSRANIKDGAELMRASYFLRRSEARNAPAGSASNDAYTSLPKRQTDREVGAQSNGSHRDCRATEEAPSADEPNVSKSIGEEAVCGSF